jgi:predicted glycosyltransferase involved in capsule biosynthesis
MPYRPADSHRPLNLAVTRRIYDEMGWPLYLGDHGGESQFSAGTARNVAATQAIHETDCDVLFIVDSDILLVEQAQIIDACEIAFELDCYVIAFEHLNYLDWEQTLSVRAGLPPKGSERASRIWGGAFAISRELWKRTGGYDPRLCGFGYDDISFVPAASTLGTHPKSRVAGDAYHLMHGPVDKESFQSENGLLAARYVAADGDPDAMRVLLAERCAG